MDKLVQYLDNYIIVEKCELEDEATRYPFCCRQWGIPARHFRPLLLVSFNSRVDFKDATALLRDNKVCTVHTFTFY